MVPGEDTRLLLASLIVVIVGGMGSVVGCGDRRRDPVGLAETYGPGARADLQRRLHLPDPHRRAGLPAARHLGRPA
jgi:hypothetical protein